MRKDHWRICCAASFMMALCGALILSGYGNMDYNEYLIGAIFLGGSASLLLLANRDLIDTSCIFTIYFILHYLVMLPLYGANLAWSQFRAFLENNWSIVAYGTFCALLALIGYIPGLLLADKFFRTSVIKPREYLTKARARQLMPLYLAMGIAGWVLILIYNESPLDTFFGRPAGRRGIFGYYTILLFCTILAFLLHLVSKTGKSFRSFGTITLLCIVLWMNLAKGARLELTIILLSSFVLSRLLNPQFRLPSLGHILKSNMKRILVGIVVVSVFSFYTSYRSDVEKLNFPDLLHSIADGAGYLVALDRYPRIFAHWNGMTYLHPFIIYIPSALFPSKYRYTYGVNEFTAEVFGYDTLNDNTTTSHTYSLIGEFYVNFGWYGISIMMFLLGYLNRSLYLKASSSSLTNLGKCGYAIYYSGVLPYIVKSGIVSGAEYFIQHFFLLLVIPLWLAGSRRT